MEKKVFEINNRAGGKETVKTKIRVAVCGQPNVGKSTLFNVLTNRKVLVANWPGVTVEKYEGFRMHRNYLIEFVDLPGIYGLYSNTLEERIARNYILSQEPDIILVLVDSLVPERTFNLALQLLELTSNVVVVFTKIDEAHKHGIHINLELLEKKLNTPVVSVSAVTNQGIDQLLDKIIDFYNNDGKAKKLAINYGELEPFIDSIVKTLSSYRDRLLYPLRWIAIKLLEGDSDLESKVQIVVGSEAFEKIKSIINEVEIVLRKNPAEIVSTYRFQYIYELFRDTIVRREVSIRRETTLSRYLYNPIIGSFFGLGLLFFVFLIAFTINTGFPLNVVLEKIGYRDLAELIEKYCISNLIEKIVENTGIIIYNVFGENIYTNLIVCGVLNGFGTVFLFLPLIMVISLTLALLEDSGIAPRIAISLHTLLSKIGVSGYAVFPILLSFGCNVPGLISTRAVPERRERFRLILTLSFIPCQARLVVLLALATAFSKISGLAVIALTYIVIFIVFVFINKLLYVIDKKLGYTVSPELLMEIPSIHKPIPRVVWWITWNNTKHFLVKAGVVIFTVSIAIWFLTSFTTSLTQATNSSESIAAQISRSITLVLYPINMSKTEYSWIPVFGLITGFLAKETLVSTLLISTNSSSIREAIEIIGLNDAQLLAYTIFTVLYIPCLATVATLYSELRSLKLTILAVFIMITVAYIVMTSTYYITILFTK